MCAIGSSAHTPPNPLHPPFPQLFPPVPPPHTHASRELISNASDALEKVRHLTVAGEAVFDAESPLAIHITTDKAGRTITISDTGLGMTREELVENLGTIARSGSKAFLNKLKAEGKESDTGSNIIGQFGVGFYSSFMVAEGVQVYSQSYQAGTPAHCWTSAGDGAYTLAAAESVPRGSKIVIQLKEACTEFAEAAVVKDLIQRHSNFVNFPIYLNGEQVNTVTALWTLGKSEVTEEQYKEFYQYKSGDFEAPLYRLHFAADAPTTIKALLYVGTSHGEKYGMGRMKSGVDLYCRKVLIEASSDILPDWLRFVQGVVDSEDIPLNISRETMQDSSLVRRLRAVLTRRLLRFLETESRSDPAKYSSTFFPEFGQFLKEGAITDAPYASDIAKLLRFESSGSPAGSLTSLDEYISRMPPGQSAIYYLVAPHRGIAETSPYMEGFKGKSEGDAVEVLFLYSSIDDFVMNNLREYGGRKLVTAETADINPDTLKGVSAAKGEAEGKGKEGEASTPPSDAPSSPPSSTTPTLTPDQVKDLASWMVATLPTRLTRVRPTNRLKSSPAVVTDHESASLRRMMRMVESTSGKDSGALKLESHILPKQSLEINPAHPIITALHTLRLSNPALAMEVAEQVVDNALVAAGLVDDPRMMLPRLNALLERVVGVVGGTPYPGAQALESKRWVSPGEAKERENIALGEEIASGIASSAGEGGKGKERE